MTFNSSCRVASAFSGTPLFGRKYSSRWTAIFFFGSNCSRTIQRKICKFALYAVTSASNIDGENPGVSRTRIMVSRLDNSLHSLVTDNFLNGFSTSSAVLNFFKNVPTDLAIAAAYWKFSACPVASDSLCSSLFPSVLFPCPVFPTITMSKYSFEKEDVPSCDELLFDM